MDHCFGTGDAYGLGVEEELLLADPESGRLVNTGTEVRERLSEPERGSVEGELSACQVELVSGVCADVDQAMDDLAALGEAVLATGTGLQGSGTHPSAEEGEADTTDSERYRLIRSLLGDAMATPVSALHVHVAMPDPETAIRAFNGLRRHLPLLEALAANSPFRHGRDTGLASAREITIRGWPRSGAPREFADFEDFAASTAALTAVAEVEDYTFHWWKMRPHPKLGTVEVRAMDVQAQPAHTRALVAAVQCLARHEAEAEPVPGPAPEILDEASYKAARGGRGRHPARRRRPPAPGARAAGRGPGADAPPGAGAGLRRRAGGADRAGGDRRRRRAAARGVGRGRHGRGAALGVAPARLGWDQPTSEGEVMRLPVLVAVCVALVVPVGCGDDDESGGSADEKKPPAETTKKSGGAQAPEITMKDISFKPTELSVKPGTTVTWTNDESVGHDVKSTGGPGPKFSSGDPGGMQQGDTFKVKLTKPGTYDYVCTVHSNMSGFVIVK